MLVRRRRLGVLATLGLSALVIACGTTYGDGTADDASAPGSDDGGAGRDDAATGADGDDDGDDAATPEDAATDAPPTFSEACPACPASSRCIASGCTGAEATATCSKPLDLVDTIAGELVAFVCPEGPTIDLPQTCVPGGNKADLNVAVLRINASASTSWRVFVTGSNAFIATGSCGQPTTCAGGTNGSNANVAGLTTVMIGTTNALEACQPITVRIEAR